jgi:hypothetical protein
MNPAPQNWKEARRFQAWHFKQHGWSTRYSAVSGHRRMWMRGGVAVGQQAHDEVEVCLLAEVLGRLVIALDVLA